MTERAEMPRYRACAMVLALVACTAPAWAQGWPSKPIRAVVPYSAGSASDILPRTVFAVAEKELGQPVVVENRGGGGNIIGTAAVAKAPPDGYTILSSSSAFTIVPVTVANPGYDALRDFVPVIPLANMANVLVVSAANGIKPLHHLVDYARADPAPMDYVNSRTGTAAHLN